MFFEVIACVVILVLIFLNVIYRNQIKNISKQLDFIKDYETNKIVSQNVSFKEITSLVEKLNEFISFQRDIIRKYRVKDETLKQTITNISHDIRTPLTSLNGYFQLLVESETEEERVRYMNIIKTRINNLKNLLEDIFTYMKIQDNNYNLPKEKCNLNKLVYNTLFSYYEDFKEKAIEPKIDIAHSEILVSTNTIALERIINNLINNSLIHGKDCISISLYKEKYMINFRIENDVEKEEDIDLENIFNRFYKQDKARTLNSTGLGLTIVKELVEAIGGSIVAKVENGVFTINIYLSI